MARRDEVEGGTGGGCDNHTWAGGLMGKVIYP